MFLLSNKGGAALRGADRGSGGGRAVVPPPAEEAARGDQEAARGDEHERAGPDARLPGKRNFLRIEINCTIYFQYAENRSE